MATSREPAQLIRAERPEDAAAIEAVTRAAFRSAPHSLQTEAFIVRALRAAGALAVSRVAVQDGQIVGHVAASPVQLAGSTGWYGLGPVSVLPALQGRGIGSALVMEALVVLSTAGAAGCVVLGEPAYYERFGFHHVPGLTLAGAPPDHFLAVAFGDAQPTGAVRYHAAFDARD